MQGNSRSLISFVSFYFRFSMEERDFLAARIVSLLNYVDL